MNRVFSLVICSYLLFSFIAKGHADCKHSDFSVPCLPKCPCETKCCPRTPAYGYEVPCRYGYTYGAGPKTRGCYCGGNAFLETALLIWTARKDGLAFATNGVSFSQVEDAGRGFYRYPDWQYRPGFQLIIGRNLRHGDDWDVLAKYTWINYGGRRNRAHEFSSYASNNEFVPTWLIQGTPEDFGLTKAGASWEFLFQAMDLEIGYHYFSSQMLSLRPFTGLKISWQDEAYRLRYSFTNPLEDTTTNFRMRQDQNYRGVGIRSGTECSFYFLRNLSITAQAALAIMMSHYDVLRKDKNFGSTIQDSTMVTANIHKDFFTLTGVFELFAGLQFDAWIGKQHRFHIQGKCGWEESVWLNHNQYIKRYEKSSHGDLMLQGLIAQLRFDY